MFSVSCYALHPLAQRFVTLWRYAGVVANCLTFLLSMLCCQCATMWPMSPTSSVEDEITTEAFKIISEPVIDAGRASGEPFRPQHLVFDFSPRPDDSEEVVLKCQRFWEVVNSHPGLEGMMVKPETDDTDGYLALKEISTSVPVHRTPPPPDQGSNFPALRVMENLTKRGTVDAALVAPTRTRPKH